MTESEDRVAALAELAEAAAEQGAAEQDGDRWSWAPAGEGLPIEVSFGTDAVRVRLAGYERAIEVDDEEPDEAWRVALDLVAAALFGDVRVREHRRGDKARRWELQLRESDHWRGFGSLGVGGLANPFAASTVRVRVNAVPRRGRFEGLEMLDWPWAPWAGAGGFSAGGRDADEPGQIPVDGEIDLHPFSPKDAVAIVRESIAAHREAGIFTLRVVHGKGTGALRRSVHAELERNASVVGFRDGGVGEGGWGATVVELRRESP